MKDVPNYVPKFGEVLSIVDYPFDKIKWKKLYNHKIWKLNPLKKLGFYKNEIKSKMYNDKPDFEPDFDAPHLGIFNVVDYCNIHDLLILKKPHLALKKKYFITDYHQLSLNRMFVMN